MVDGPRIVGLGGSASSNSITEQLLQRCLKLTESLGAQTIMLTGEQLSHLPIYTVDSPVPAGVGAERLLAAVRQADALVIATPGYHGGMSGLLKNALDHLEALRIEVPPYLDGRAVGVIVAASGWQACGTALVSVRSAIHALRGWPTPLGVTVNSAEQPPSATGAFEAGVEASLGVLAQQLVDFATGAIGRARPRTAREPTLEPSWGEESG
jgi:FMN reductase